MLFVWIALWLASLLLLTSNRKSVVVRWLALVSLCGGFGALASTMEGWIVSMYNSGGIDAAQERLLRLLQNGCSWMSYYGLPYSFLCFAAAYHTALLPKDSERFSLHSLIVKALRWLPYGALLLPLCMLFLPAADVYAVHFDILAVWAIPYIAIGLILLLTKRVLHPADRRAHAILTAAILPAIMIALTMNYIMPLFGLYGMWRYNIWPITFAFIVFIVALFKFGFLGVQLLIERRQLDFSLRAITSGTAMLNHAIKNDIGKIKLFSDKIDRAAETDQEGMQELREDIKVIASAALHIEAMIRSVHDRTQELRLQPQRISLSELVREQLAALAPRAAGHVSILAEYDERAEAEVDSAQTGEAISNILNNAIEAMPGGGELAVKVISGRRGCTITIRDNGSGIDKKHLRKVTEPFFTTKSGKAMNFGLGLAYCSQLMNRQRGELRIQSEAGKGTTVTLHFPIPRRAKGA
ncbi:HAMP domain-containing histidine kinase [Paenibacillus oenotherae]|uniref:histidine kinase n=1 Tax=Paenibacillus oenotherae TaxID=1435645 RepID=A0ABS7D9J6_9BACL|nr:HAMP domain-containing sensor histidine kinase [Paenibacillus oenotherae]MBW7476612.1 HAMP domain-containing histidine kinase [Paenibacillus oenotherae]